MLRRGMGLKCHKTCKTLNNVVKLGRNHKKVPVFPVSCSKELILRRFLKILRRPASPLLQLLEALCCDFDALQYLTSPNIM